MPRSRVEVQYTVGTGQAYPLQVNSVPVKLSGTSNTVSDSSLVVTSLIPSAGMMLSMTGLSVDRDAKGKTIASFCDYNIS